MLEKTSKKISVSLENEVSGVGVKYLLSIVDNELENIISVTLFSADGSKIGTISTKDGDTFPANVIITNIDNANEILAVIKSDCKEILSNLSDY